MLTKDDLNQIRGIVREEVKDEVSTQLKPIHLKLKNINRELKFIPKDYANAIGNVRKRVDRIEHAIGLADA